MFQNPIPLLIVAALVTILIIVAVQALRRGNRKFKALTKRRVSVEMVVENLQVMERCGISSTEQLKHLRTMRRNKTIPLCLENLTLFDLEEVKAVLATETAPYDPAR